MAKGLLSDKARRILADRQGSEQLMEFILSHEDEATIELEDGTNYVVSETAKRNKDTKFSKKTMKYRHFKGGIYTYICDALLEWDEDCHVIVYEDEQGRRWVRPRVEFYGMIEYEGEIVRRFEKVEDNE